MGEANIPYYLSYASDPIVPRTHLAMNKKTKAVPRFHSPLQEHIRHVDGLGHSIIVYLPPICLQAQG